MPKPTDRGQRCPMNALAVPIIYNLFPRLAGTLDRWDPHLERAAEMGFNWVFLNPIFYPGFSGSLYAVSDYLRLDPVLVPPGSTDDRIEAIRPLLQRMRDLGLRPMVDLVINHTARDSALVEGHPDWYVRDERGEVASPYAVDPDNPAHVTVWGDLAEIDNAGSPDRDSLWRFWASVVERYLDVGFAGFRCDAAYKVPSELWRYLVDVATRRDPEARFFGETLGCTLEQARALRASGLHFFFNSSKWWDFRAAWALDQHREFQDIPSISFPETHDTERLAAESEGSEAVQRQRYAFAATFSAGLMLPMGYEFCFRRRLDVVSTRPEHWEAPTCDLRAFVTRVNRLKREQRVLHGEGELERLTAPDEPLLALRRRTTAAPGETAWIVVNLDRSAPQTLAAARLGGAAEPSVLRLCRDAAPSEGEALPELLALDPAEVVLVVSGGG